MIKINSVLIADEIEQPCIDSLVKGGVNVVKKTKLPVNELIRELQKHDAVVVRSATKITRAVFEGCPNLKLVARAGTGVDNIDVDAGTENGTIVMNTPAGNSRSAAELTSTLILSMSRNVPQGVASMKAGRWDRKLFMGTEVHGKTLAIIGLGRIGQIVAGQMQAFGMTTIGFDPMVSAETAAKSGIEWLPLEEIWKRADYITVHVPLIPQTKNLINLEVLRKCRKGVKIINVARGGIVNEEEIVEALNEGICGGFAVDVYTEEPPTNRALIDHPKVSCLPHLGASTIEAQERVAVEVAENIVALNEGRGLFGALNGHCLGAVLDETKVQVVKAITDLAQVLASLTSTKAIKVKCPLSAKGVERAIPSAVIMGLLCQSGGRLNFVNAEKKGKELGYEVSTEFVSGAEFHINAGGRTVSGYYSPAGTFISEIDGRKVPSPVLAMGVLAITLATNGNSPILSDQLRTRVSVEYGLFGGGRLALFEKLTGLELEEISRAYNVVQFA
ncbi:unnamed protein product [Bursaphelenchus xylophilus]|uniref:(pine wood nematode) hypothetical protein n=1 Tax=Bursaphelenchus xylophilus TaxID=6326 RepID=A0A1I7RPI4_BURXY|nr:unnamed protein product [Bursaphelenchus xylophilus]CAG9096074.1 unnamed protein product [Bursaphelenchus xylophilus]